LILALKYIYNYNRVLTNASLNDFYTTCYEVCILTQIRYRHANTVKLKINYKTQEHDNMYEFIKIY